MNGEERWKPVVGYEGHYEVSDLGRVRSLDRYVYAGPKAGNRIARGRVLKPSHNGHHLVVNLCTPDGQRTWFVHQLVAYAFLGPRPEGLEVCHGDDDPWNNRLTNLRYDTRRGNMLDRRKNGAYQAKTHCKHGHEFTPENTKLHGETKICRTCRHRIKMNYYWRKTGRPELQELI